MPKFNVAKYDRVADSSPGSGAKPDGPVVLVYPTELVCRCGCGQPTRNVRSRFRQGHDARLKGILIRAAVTGTKIEIREGDDKPVTVTAAAAAKAFGFEHQVRQAKDRYTAEANQVKAAATKRAAEAKSKAAAPKARKPRSDKGVKRGPKNPTPAPAVEAEAS